MTGPIHVKGDGLPCWRCGTSPYADCAHRPAERKRKDPPPDKWREATRLQRERALFFGKRNRP